VKQSRRENARWIVLRILEAGRPIGASETVVSRILADIRMRYSVEELRTELIYLHKLGLIDIDRRDRETWTALQGLGLIDVDQQYVETWWVKLTAHGIRVVEYSTAAPAGIGRPRGD